MFFFNTLKQALIRIVICFVIAALLVILASYIDIIAHNSMPNPVYQAWNIFTNL